jgi:hypothetical protein
MQVQGRIHFIKFKKGNILLVRCQICNKVIFYLQGIFKICIERTLFPYEGLVFIVKLKSKEMGFKHKQFSLHAKK